MKPLLRIVADAHIWGVESAFAAINGFNVSLRILENREITSGAVRDADILLTRSSTRVDQSLLEGSGIRFVATATIGDDHFDKTYLASRGIIFANAAGSSTGSVIEYAIAALLELQNRDLLAIPGASIGIIGAGRIGGALAKICNALGMRAIIHDPPRSRAEGSAGFLTLDNLLQQADVLTLHTPLIRTGKDCTVHLLDQEHLSRFQGKGVINTGRGACVDNAALADWMDDDPARFAVLDCWEHEPSPSRQLRTHPQLAIGTPHIAGHSLDGKAANTQYAYNALCRWLKVTPEWNAQDHLPPPDTPVEIICTGNPWRDLPAAITRLYPIAADHEAMRAWGNLSEPELAEAFTAWRRHYPVRRAWEYLPVHFFPASHTLQKLAQALGMKIV